MSEEDFQERDDPANRERDRARLVRVSSAAGVETEASASAGASVESLLIKTCYMDLVREHPDRYVFHEDEFNRYSVRWVDEAREYDEKPPTQSGRRRKGVHENEEIWAAILRTQEPIRVRFRIEGERLIPVVPPPSLKWLRAELAGRAIAQGEVNVEALAIVLGVSRSQPYRWAKRPSVREWKSGMRQNAGTGRAMLERLESIDARLETAQVELDAARADLHRTVADVLERFPGDERVQAAVDRFVDDALAD